MEGMNKRNIPMNNGLVSAKVSACQKMVLSNPSRPCWMFDQLK